MLRRSRNPDPDVVVYRENVCVLADTIVSRNSNLRGGINVYDAEGLRWAIDQAMTFYQLPDQQRARQIRRVMQEAAERFTHEKTAQKYIDVYEKMLERPLTKPF